jgi:hypothetical protein
MRIFVPLAICTLALSAIDTRTTMDQLMDSVTYWTTINNTCYHLLKPTKLTRNLLKFAQEIIQLVTTQNYFWHWQQQLSPNVVNNSNATNTTMKLF